MCVRAVCKNKKMSAHVRAWTLYLAHSERIRWLGFRFRSGWVACDSERLQCLVCLSESLYQNSSHSPPVKIGERHPDPVVETSSLSSVNPPNVWYRLSLPEETIDRGWLSALQLEAITYASQVCIHELTSEVGNPGGVQVNVLLGLFYIFWGPYTKGIRYYRIIILSID